MEVENTLQPLVEQIVSLMNLPLLGGTWEDEEATSWQFPYTSDVCYNIPLDDSTTALGLFNSFFTQAVSDLLVQRDHSVCRVEPNLQATFSTLA